MRLQVIAIGRLKSGPERELVERYRTRVDAIGKGLGVGALDLAELAEGRSRSAPERRAEEAGAILAKVGEAKLVAFDERGASLSSEAFAEQIRARRDEGSALALAIGGPDGLSPQVRSRADLVLSFGRLTLPHQFVRILAVEQIYRALTILAGHPYHRGEPGRE